MQRFTRSFHGSSYKLKDLSKFIDKSKTFSNGEEKLPTLKGSPTIYNPVKSASNYKGFMKAKIEPGLYFNPSQSTPTGSINVETYPDIFLAKDDPRTNLIKQIRANDPLRVSESAVAPPVLISKTSADSKGKKYHLKPEQIQEIIELRSKNPEKYTRKVLAEKYNVSPLFISIVASASEKRVAEMESRLDIIKSKWHPKRVIARADRKKRNQFWYRA